MTRRLLLIVLGFISFFGVKAQQYQLDFNLTVEGDSILLLETEVINTGASSFAFSGATVVVPFYDTTGLDFMNRSIRTPGIWSPDSSVCYSTFDLNTTAGDTAVIVQTAFDPLAGCSGLEPDILLTPGDTGLYSVIAIPITGCFDTASITFDKSNSFLADWGIVDISDSITARVYSPTDSTLGLNNFPGFGFFTQDTTLCGVDSVEMVVTGTLNAGYTYEFWQFDNSGPAQALLSTQSGVDTTFFATGLDDNDSLYVVVYNYNQCSDSSAGVTIDLVNVDLTLADSLVCDTGDITLVGPPAMVSWLWQDTSANLIGSLENQVINISQDTVVVLTVDSLGCLFTDTMSITIMNGAFGLGNDTTLCDTGIFVIDGPASYSSYAWTDSAGTAIDVTEDLSINIQQDSSLVLSADSLGCIFRDTMEVALLNAPINLGFDSLVCDTGVITIDGPANYTSYAWTDSSGAPIDVSEDLVINIQQDSSLVLSADTMGCTVTDTIEVTILNVAFLLEADSIVCDTGVITLDGPALFSNYAWTDTTGAPINVTEDLIINIQQDTALVLTADTNGCIVRDSIEVSILNAGFALGNDTTFCSPGLVTILGVPGYTNYAWTDTNAAPMAVTQDLSFNAVVDSAVVLFADSMGCTYSDTLEASLINALFALDTDSTVCDTGSITIDGPAGYTNYTWSDTSGAPIDVTEDLIINIQSDTALVLMADSSICSYTDTIEVSISNTPFALGNDTAFCAPGAVTITGPVGYTNYAWTDTAGTPILAAQDLNVVFTQDSAFVLTADSASCTYTDTIEATLINAPFVLAADSLVCDTGSITIDGPAGYTSYAWSDTSGAPIDITEDLVINIQQDTALVLTADSISCTYTDTIEVTILNVAFLLEADSIVCDTGVITLDGPALFSNYAWTDTTGAPINVTEDLIINIQQDTALVLTADTNGCIVRDSIEVSILNAGFALGNDTTFCSPGLVTILGVPGYTNYAWTDTNAAPMAVTQDLSFNAVVDSAVVLFADSMGCTYSDTLEASLINALFALDTDSTVCDTGSITIDGPAGYTNYAWSDTSGAPIDITEDLIINIQSDTALVLMADSSICSYTDTIEVSISNTPFALGNDTAFCAPGAVTITGPVGYTNYAWTDTSGTPILAAQDLNVVFTQDSAFVLTADSASCTYTDTIEATLINAPFVLAADSLVCDTGSITIDGPANYTSYAWSDTSGAPIDITEDLVINIQSDTALVLTADSLSCIYTDTIEVSLLNAVFALAGDSIVCDTGVITLDGPTGFTNYAWADTAGAPIDISEDLIINIQQDTALVLTADTNGCIVRDSIEVSILNAGFALGNDTTFCSPGLVTILGVPGYTNYAWTDTNAAPMAVTQDLSFNAVVDSAVVLFADSMGCTYSDTLEASLINALFALDTDSTVCDTGSITIDGPAGYTNYAWSDTSGAPIDVTEDLIINIQSDTALVLIADSSICSYTDTIEVSISNTPFALGNDTAFCAPGAVTITGPVGYTNYAWTDTSGTPILAAQDLNVVFTQDSAFVLTADSASCTYTDTIEATLINAPFILAADSLVCDTGSITIDGPANYTSYAWSDTSGAPIDITEDLVINIQSDTALVLTADSLSCIYTDTIEVRLIAAQLGLGADSTICAPGLITIDAASGFTNYSWADTASNILAVVEDLVINIIQDTSIVLTADTASCTVTDSIDVVIMNAPINLGLDSVVCDTGSITIDGPSGYTAYAWVDSAGTPLSVLEDLVINIQNDSSLVLTVDTASCSYVDTINVTAALFTVDLGPDTNTNAGNVVLSPGQYGAGTIYNWSTGSSNDSITVSTADTFWVDVDSAGLGCIRRDSVIVTGCNYTVDLGLDDTLCGGDSIKLSPGQYGVGTTYSWVTGETSDSIFVDTAGVYWVDVDSAGVGCSIRDSIVITVLDFDVALVPDTNICVDDTIALVAPSFGSALTTFSWTGGSTNDTLLVSATGTYTVQVDSLGLGCVISDSVVVGRVNIRSLTLGNDTSVCAGAFTLNGPAGMDSYLWQDTSGALLGNTNPLNTVITGANEIVLTADSAGCGASDTIGVFIGTSGFTLNDSTLCGGNITVFGPGGFNSYLWTNFDGDTLSELQDIAGLALLNDTSVVLRFDSAGCIGQDTMDLTVNNIVVTFDLGPDTTILCQQVITFNGPANFTNYRWTDPLNNLLGSNQNLSENIFQDTTLYLAADSAGCTGVDSVNAFLGGQGFTLGADTNACKGPFSISGPNGLASYNWFNSDTTAMGSSQILSFTLTQDTTVVLAALLGTCIATDTIQILSSKSISFDIGGDRATCNDSTMVFNSPSNLVNEVWVDLSGDTLGFGNTVVIDIDRDTTVMLFADSLTCSSSDTLFVDYQGFTPDLGPDTSDCGDILVSTDITGFANTWYRLVAGDTVVGGDQVSTVTAPLDETIIIETDDGNCIGFDTVEILFPDPLAAVNDTASIDYLSGDSLGFTFNTIAGALYYEVSAEINGLGYSAFDSTGVKNGSNSGSFGINGLVSGDSVCVAYRAVGECDSSLSDTTCYLAFDCHVTWSGLDTVGGYCSSSFNEILRTDSVQVTPFYFEGPGVNSFVVNPDSTLWYWSPPTAGAGVHDVSLIGCYALDTNTQTVVVQAAPCADPVDTNKFSTRIKAPQGIYTDCDGQIYFTSANVQNILVRIDTFGFDQHIAGQQNVLPGFADGHATTEARLATTIGLNVDPIDSLVYFVGFINNCVRYVDMKTDSVYTIAGGGNALLTPGAGDPGESGDSDNPVDYAANRMFNEPFGLTINASRDTLYVSDQGNGKIKLIALNKSTSPISFDTVYTIAGDGTDPGFGAPLEGPALAVGFKEPAHISLDGTRLYIGDERALGAQAIRYYDFKSDSVKNLFVTSDGYADGVLGASEWRTPIGVAADGKGGLYVVENGNCTLRKIEGDSVISILGDGSFPNCTIDPLTDPSTTLDAPTGLSVFVKGFIDIVDTGNDIIKRVSVADFLSGPFASLPNDVCTGVDSVQINSNDVAGFYSSSVPGLVKDTLGSWLFFPPFVTQDSVVSLRFTHNVGSCVGFEDFEVTIRPLPIASLGSDTALCPISFGSATLAQIDTAGIEDYQWFQQGLTSSSFGILADDTNYFATVDSLGDFVLVVASRFGCTDSDTISVGNSPDLIIDITSSIGTDSACYGTSADLTVNKLSAGPGIVSYAWLTGDSTQSLTVDFSADYSVVVQDSVGCTVTETWRHLEKNAPVACITIDTSLENGQGYKYGQWAVGTLAGQQGVIGHADDTGDAALFGYPWGLALDGEGNLYVSEVDIAASGNNLIRRISLNDTSVTTVAGTVGSTGPEVNGDLGEGNSQFDHPYGMVYRNGKLYVADNNNHEIRVLDFANDTVYGMLDLNSELYVNGDPSTARIDDPFALAMDDFGRLFIADYDNHAIRVVETDGDFSTYAGQLPDIFLAGTGGFVNDTGTSAFLNWPLSLTVGNQGELYFNDENSGMFRTINLDTAVSDYAGISAGFVDGPYASAEFSQKFTGTIVDKEGRLWMADYGNHAIRILDVDGQVKTITGVPGTGVTGYQDGAADSAEFFFPRDLVYDNTRGIVYISDQNNNVIRTLRKNKTILICASDTVDLDGTCSGAADYVWNGPLGFTDSNAVVQVQDAGTYYLDITMADGCTNTDSVVVKFHTVPGLNVNDNNPLICRDDSVDIWVDSDPGFVSYAWTDTTLGTLLSSGPLDTLLTVQDSTVYGITAVDTNGCVVSDFVRVIHDNVPADTMIFLAQRCQGDQVVLNGKDSLDPVFVFFSYNNTVWQDSTVGDSIIVTESGVYNAAVNFTTGAQCHTNVTYQVQYNLQAYVDIATAGQSDTSIYVGTVTGLSAGSDPYGIAKDTAGNVYMAANGLNRIVRVDPAGGILLVAGDGGGSSGFADGIGAAARFDSPQGLAIRGNDLYVADLGNNSIRRIDLTTFEVSTYAGTPGSPEIPGLPIDSTHQDGPLLSSRFFHPYDLEFAANGNLYVSDKGNNCIREISPLGYVTTIGVASNVAGGFVNGNASIAEFNAPHAISVTPMGLVVIGEDQRIRGYNPFDSTVSVEHNTVAPGNPYDYGSVIGLDAFPWGGGAGADSDPVVWGLDESGSVSSVFAGNELLSGTTDGGAQVARFSRVHDVLYDEVNNKILMTDGIPGNSLRYLYDSTHVEICAGDSIWLVASPMVPGGAYSWNGPLGASFSTNDSVFVGDGGVYVVEYTDPGTGCVGYDSITVNQLPTPLIDTLSPDTMLCPGQSMAVFVKSVNPGDSVGIFGINPGTGLPIDTQGVDSVGIMVTYAFAQTIRVRVSNGVCDLLDSVVVSPSDLALSLTPLTDTICYGSSVEIVGVPTGGAGGYVFAWDTTGGIGSGNFIGIEPDTFVAIPDTIGFENRYALEVTDAQGCSISDTASIWMTDSLFFSFNDLDDTVWACTGKPDTVGASAVVSGGTGAVTYLWSTSSTNISLTDATTDSVKISVTTAIADTAFLRLDVTDSIGCTHSDSMILILDDFQITVSAQHLIICPEMSDTLSARIVSGGVGPFGVRWIQGDSLDDSTIVAPAAMPTVTNQYMAVMIDSTTGCRARDSITIQINTIVANIADSLYNACGTDTVQLDGSSSVGALEFTLGDPLLYAWTKGIVTADDTIPGTDSLALVSGGTPGTTSLYYLDITDSLGCSARDSAYIFWNPSVTVSPVIDSVFICAGLDDTLRSQNAGGGSSPFNYGWTVLSGTLDLTSDTAQQIVGATYSVANGSDTSEVLLTAMDSLGCIGTDTVTVIGLDLQIAVSQAADTTCPSDSNQLGVVVNSGGLGTYVYAWTPALALDDDSIANPIATPTVTTSFGVNVTDSVSGCVAADNLTIEIIDLIARIGVAQGPDTFVVCDGDSYLLIADSSTGGSPFKAGNPYEYNWLEIVGTSTGMASPDSSMQVTVSAGTDTSTFVLEVIDTLGCTTFDTTSLVWNTPITANAIDDTIYICSGAVDSLSADTATGGIAGYQYSWTSGSGVVTINSGSSQYASVSITTGDTAVVLLDVTDTVGCSAQDSVVVIGVDLVASAQVEFGQSCVEIGDTLTASVTSGGVGPFSYAWTPSDSLADSTASITAVNNTATTNYTVTILDSATGCSATSSILVSIDSVVASATGTSPVFEADTLVACYGDADLTASQSAGGLSPYAFAWSSTDAGVIITPTNLQDVSASDNGTASAFSQLTVTITDSIGCVGSDSVVVMWNDSLGAQITSNPFVCVGDTVDMVGGQVGGTAPFSYAWQDLALDDSIQIEGSLTNDSASVVALASIGSNERFVLEVTDSVGCVAYDTIDVTARGLIVNLVTASDTVCSGIPVLLTATDSLANGTVWYSWDNSLTFVDTSTAALAPLGTTTFTVIAVDSLTLCEASDSVVVTTEDISATINTSASTDMCFSDDSLGLDILGLSGGNGNYTFGWYQLPNDTVPFASGNATNYLSAIPTGSVDGDSIMLRINDTDGCLGFDTLEVFRNAEILANATLSPNDTVNICAGASDTLGGNAITPSGSGGSGSLNFAWATSDADIFLFDAGLANAVAVIPASGSGPKEVILTVSDADAKFVSCSVIDTVIVNAIATPAFNLEDTVICGVDSIYLGSDTVFNTGTVFTWIRNGVDTLVNAQVNNDSLQIGTTGLYELYITDQFGCEANRLSQVTANDPPTLSINAMSPIQCSNATVAISATRTPGDGTFTWTVVQGLGNITHAPTDSVVVYPTDLNDDSVGIHLRYQNSCGFVEDSIGFNTVAPPIAEIYVPDTLVNTNEQVTFNDNGGNVGTYTWSWTFGAQASPVAAIGSGPHDVTWTDEGNFDVEMIIEDDVTGCEDTARVGMSVVSSKMLYVPNVFSPMANNFENQSFKVYGFNVSNADFELWVYNRWGEVIYKTTSFSDANTVGWDGTHMSTGDDQDVGTYTWTLRGKFTDGEVIERAGTVTLLR